MNKIRFDRESDREPRDQRQQRADRKKYHTGHHRHVIARDVSTAKILSCFQQLNSRLLPKSDCWEAYGPRVRRASALPIYTVALILSFAGDLLGYLAARLAGDDWPR
jgi:hypothetical protein